MASAMFTLSLPTRPKKRKADSDDEDDAFKRPRVALEDDIVTRPVEIKKSEDAVNETDTTDSTVDLRSTHDPNVRLFTGSAVLEDSATTENTTRSAESEDSESAEDTTVDPSMATIIINNDRKFVIDKELLCDWLLYFENAYMEGTQEAKSNVFHLNNVNEEAFEDLVLWLRTGDICERLEDPDDEGMEHDDTDWFPDDDFEAELSDEEELVEEKEDGGSSGNGEHGEEYGEKAYEKVDEDRMEGLEEMDWEDGIDPRLEDEWEGDLDEAEDIEWEGGIDEGEDDGIDEEGEAEWEQEEIAEEHSWSDPAFLFERIMKPKTKHYDEQYDYTDEAFETESDFDPLPHEFDNPWSEEYFVHCVFELTAPADLDAYQLQVLLRYYARYSRYEEAPQVHDYEEIAPVYKFLQTYMAKWREMFMEKQESEDLEEDSEGEAQEVYDRLIDLYILAETLGAPELRNELITQMQRAHDYQTALLGGNPIPNFHSVAKAFKSLPKKSQMRRWILDVYALE